MIKSYIKNDKIIIYNKIVKKFKFNFIIIRIIILLSFVIMKMNTHVYLFLLCNNYCHLIIARKSLFNIFIYTEDSILVDIFCFHFYFLNK